MELPRLVCDGHGHIQTEPEVCEAILGGLDGTAETRL
jgi:hypothetical protein